LGGDLGKQQLQILLQHYLKSEIAFKCNLNDTRSVDMWVARGKVPMKYHNVLNRMLNELLLKVKG